MRSWLRALLLGFLFGPVPMAGEPVEVDGLEAEAAPEARRSSGCVAQGSGFYVWDEGSREAADWAVALAAPFEAVGVASALEQLERDPSPAVRRLARAATASRRGSGIAPDGSQV